MWWMQLGFSEWGAWELLPTSGDHVTPSGW